MEKVKRYTASALAALIALSALAAAPVSAASVGKPKVTVSNASNGVKISWNKAKGAQKYVVSRKEGKKAYKTLTTVKAGKKLTYTDKKAKAGKKYTYSVKSISGSAYASAAKSVVFLKAPTSVKAVLKQDDFDAVSKITYKKSTGAKKYEIYRAEVNGSKTGKYKKLASVKKLSYSDWTSAEGVTYKYKVRAVNGSSKSAYSKATKKFSYLYQIYATARINDNYDGVRLEWEPAYGVTSYKIYRAEGTNGKFKLLKDSSKFTKEKDKLLGTSVYVYNDKDVKSETIYKYYVIAYKGSLKSGYSDDVVAAVYFSEYSMLLQTGKVDTSLNGLYNIYKSSLSASVSVVSDNEDVVKAEITTDSSGNSVLGLRAVSAGDAVVTMKIAYMGETADIAKLKIRVTDEPVYAATVKAGEKAEAGNYSQIFATLFAGDGMDDLFKVELSTDTPDIISVDKDKNGTYYITGNKAGVGSLKVKMTAEKMLVMENTYDVLVTEN